MWENTGLSLDELIRDRKRSRRPAPYSLYTADLGKGAYRPRSAGSGGGGGLGGGRGRGGAVGGGYCGSSPSGTPRGSSGTGPILIGRVRSFDPRTGWGLIDCDGSRRGIILHASELVDVDPHTLEAGDVVRFELSMSVNGNSRASAVHLVDRGAPDTPTSGVPRARAAVLVPGPGAAAASTPRGSRASSLPSSPMVPPLAPLGGLAAALARRLGDGDGPENFYIGEGSTPRSAAVEAAPLGGSPKMAKAGRGQGSRVRVKNFPWTMTRRQVKIAFEACGEVLRVDFDEQRVSQAVVTFREPQAAQRAVKDYDRGLLNNREIFVRHER